MEEQMEMSSVMDSSAERITPSQMSTIWKPDLSRNANDTSSPGKFKICYDQIEKVDEKLKKKLFCFVPYYLFDIAPSDTNILLHRRCFKPC